MRRHLTACLLSAAAIHSAGCESPSLSPTPAVITIAVHPLRASRIASVLTKVMADATPPIGIRISEIERGVDMVKSVESASTDCAFVTTDVAYLAYAGELDGHEYRHVRGVAVLGANPVYVIIQERAAVADIFDLDGRTVSLGLEGGATAVTIPLMFEAVGITASLEYQPFPEAIDRLAAGRLDAVLAVGSYPLEPLQAGLSKGIRVLPLPSVSVDRIHAKHPFLRAVVIPRGIYSADPILTMGVERLIVCRDGLDPELTRRFTKTFIEALPLLSQVDPPLRTMNVEEARATLVPLHEGAARYYREQE